MESSKRVIRQLLYLIIISIGSKLLGFVREFIVAYKLGTSIESDAYFLAITISVTFCGGIIAAFSTSFIPVYARIKNESDEKSQKFINNLQTFIFLFQVFIVIVFFALKSKALGLFFPKADTSMIQITDRLASIMVFSVIASGVRSVVGGYLQYNNKTSVVYFGINIIQNIIVIFSIFLYCDNIDILGYGYVIAGIIVAAFLIVVAYRNGFRYSFDLNLKSPLVKEAILLTCPIFINQILIDINTFFDKSIASSLGTGIVSSLNYAYKINDIFIVTFATTLATALYPEISKLIAANNNSDASILLRKSIRQVTMFLLPFSFVLLFYSNEIVELLLMRGAFNQDSAVITAQCLMCYSVGMLFFAYRQIFYRIMLSCKMTKKIMINSLLTVTLNVTLNLILSRLLGYRGIAIATSVSMAIMTIIMSLDISKSNIKISLIQFWKDNAVYFLVSLIVVVIPYIFYTIVNRNKYLLFIICVVVSALMYLVLLWLKKDDCFYEMVNTVRCRFINKKAR